MRKGGVEGLAEGRNHRRGLGVQTRPHVCAEAKSGRMGTGC